MWQIHSPLPWGHPIGLMGPPRLILSLFSRPHTRLNLFFCPSRGSGRVSCLLLTCTSREKGLCYILTENSPNSWSSYCPYVLFLDIKTQFPHWSKHICIQTLLLDITLAIILIVTILQPPFRIVTVNFANYVNFFILHIFKNMFSSCFWVPSLSLQILLL